MFKFLNVVGGIPNYYNKTAKYSHSAIKKKKNQVCNLIHNNYIEPRFEFSKSEIKMVFIYCSLDTDGYWRINF